jgi:hypothetical protein
MEEAHEEGKESPNSAHGNGMNENMCVLFIFCPNTVVVTGMCRRTQLFYVEKKTAVFQKNIKRNTLYYQNSEKYYREQVYEVKVI